MPDYEGYDSKQLSKMTHLEPFSQAVSGFVLFDYRNRSPLTGEARTVFLRKKADNTFEEFYKF